MARLMEEGNHVVMRQQGGAPALGLRKITRQVGDG